MLALLVCFWCATSWALDSGLTYTQALAHARSAQEVERLNQNYSRLKVAQTACQIELNERSAPVSCYEAVELEMPAKSALKTSRLAHLDKLCASAANQLHLSEPGAFVSKDCVRFLRDAREIQQYRDEEDSAWSSY